MFENHTHNAHTYTHIHTHTHTDTAHTVWRCPLAFTDTHCAPTYTHCAHTYTMHNAHTLRTLCGIAASHLQECCWPPYFHTYTNTYTLRTLCGVAPSHLQTHTHTKCTHTHSAWHCPLTFTGVLLATVSPLVRVGRNEIVDYMRYFVSLGASCLRVYVCACVSVNVWGRTYMDTVRLHYFVLPAGCIYLTSLGLAKTTHCVLDIWVVPFLRRSRFC